MTSAWVGEPAVAMPSGRVTFLFTDVVGSTRLFQLHGDAFVETLHQVQGLVRAAVENSGGVVVNTEGDSTFAAFHTAADGLSAARAAQRGVDRLRAEPGLHIRAGLHTGPAQPLQGDYLALAVHVASRVAAAAGADQILVSDEALSAAGPVHDDAVDLGLFELRDVIDPVHLWRIAGPDEPPRARPVRRTNVQPAHTSLVGREPELSRLADALTEHPLVTVLGAGGMGKTRVASELAIRLAPSFAGGAWLIELAGVARDDAVAAAVRNALAIPADESERDVLVADLDRRGPTLIVLDNCEHVLEGAAELAEHVGRASPTTRLLATSREALEVPGEFVVRLQPLAHDDEHGPAEQLFRQRADRAGAVISEGDTALVRHICQLLDGLPLAIELAASRSAIMPLAELRAALEQDAHSLALAHRRGDPRQRSLGALVDWSVRLLTRAERTDLLCLSAFAVRFTGADAAALLRAARGEGRPSTAELVRRGLVDLDGDRYRLLFPVRVATAKLLSEDPELAAAVDAALVAWANQRVEAARLAGWRGASDELAAERANLENALRAAARRRLDAPHVLRIIDRLWDRDGLTLPVDLGSALVTRLDEPVPGDADGLRMLLSIFDVTRGVGFVEAPGRRVDLMSEVIRAARRVDDPETLVDALSTLAPLVAAAGEIEQARAMYQEVIAMAGQGGPWHRPARDLVNMAVSYQVGADPLEALPWYERAVVAAARTGDEDNRAIALVNAGDVLMMAGRLRQASDLLRQGVHAIQHLSRSGIAARAILADVLVRLDEPNALDYAYEAARDFELLMRVDDSMSDYLERLRTTIAAAERANVGI